MDKVVEDFSLEIIIDDFTKQISTTIDDIILRNPLSHYEFSEMIKRIESPRKDELMIAHSDHPFILQVCTYLEEIMLNTSRYERPFCVSIEGHPSSGKSTSLKEIATRLSVFFRDEKLKVLPIFQSCKFGTMEVKYLTAVSGIK